MPLVARAEQQRILAESSKAQAEARKAHAEADIMETVAAAVRAQAGTRVTDLDLDGCISDLKQAVRRINSKGGGLFLDEGALRQIAARPEDEPKP